MFEPPNVCKKGNGKAVRKMWQMEHLSCRSFLASHPIGLSQKLFPLRKLYAAHDEGFRGIISGLHTNCPEMRRGMRPDFVLQGIQKDEHLAFQEILGEITKLQFFLPFSEI